jgi:hypothetical protein
MSSSRVTQQVPIERVERLIHLARGEKVLLDADLAKLYGVSTGALNRAVKRNAARFPADFMFELTADEAQILKCQIGISSSGHGGRRRSFPCAFTEQGVAMLSSVLRSERAVQVNVAIMRAFVSLRRMLSSNDALSRKLAELSPKGAAAFGPRLAQRAYLGCAMRDRNNLNGVVAFVRFVLTQPRWGCGFISQRFPRVARTSQPWALRHSPVGAGEKQTRNEP